MSENSINPQILDKLTKVCLCKAISRATIKKAIENGAKTVEEVKKATGATTGGCGGKRCTPKIQQLIDEYKNK
ncbi:(2Fe-2S)-binding protein [Haloimpatiens massiliensis]|uniref:(2Fe-2S)-binding protein n=1 Tax=Haloimpatiens massiliensis TaxID=1658110 RepID=UPI000C8535C7|nr:(2Fe-2S)-binding protein [Haloimpatiens massiliensis]